MKNKKFLKIYEWIIQIFVILGIIIFTKTDINLGRNILLSISFIWIFGKILSNKFYIYELMLMVMIALLTGTNYLFYAGIIIFIIYFMVFLKDGTSLKIDKETMFFGIMVLTGITSSVLNAVDTKSANLYITVYLGIFVMLFGIRIARKRIVIEEKAAIKLFVWISFLIGFGFFMTHTISQLFGTKHIFIYYISNYGIYSNTLAGILAPFLIGNVLTFIKVKDKFTKVISLISSIMFLLIILAIQSRGAYLGILISVLWLCVKKKSPKAIIYIIIALIIIMFVAILFPEIFTKFFARFSLAHFSNGDFSNGRSEIFKMAWKMFYEHPIIGCGFWQFEIHGNIYSDPHNFILSYLGSTGIIGTMAFMGYLISCYKRLNYEYEHSDKYSKLLSEIVMVSFLITVGHGMVEPTLSTSAPLTIFILMTSLPTLISKEK